MLSPQEKLEALKRIGLMPRDKNESVNFNSLNYKSITKGENK